MTTSGGAPRQTASFLRDLFAVRNIHPKKKLGQNFLIDLNLIDVLLRAAELSPLDLVLEVGAGTGGLTGRLIEQAGAVVSVEIDHAFAALVEEIVAPMHGRAQLIHADILKGKNDLNPDVLHALEEMAERAGTTELKLVANLPYAVATPVISNLLMSQLTIERMVVTVQWEIAERLLATPDSRDYGALSVLIQSLADVDLIRKLPPTVFWPRPLVDSAIVRIRPNAAKRAEVGDVPRFRAFLRDLYSHRRKNLRGALVTMAGSSLDKAEADRRLVELGIDGTVRAETLDRAQHLRLCAVFGSDTEPRTSSRKAWKDAPRKAQSEEEE